MIAIVRDVYEKYGYEPLETPAFENIETLLGKYGDEGNKLIFKILRRGEHEASGEADLALRYDLTVPLARVIAQYQNELPKFWKRYQIQPVWRADRPAKGRFREFYQCDVDVMGSTAATAEAEVLGAVSEVLSRLGFDNFEIRLNHRALLTALLQIANVPEHRHSDALVTLDKFDKIGKEGVATELGQKGFDSEAAASLLSLFPMLLEKSSTLDRVSKKLGNHAVGMSAVAKLNEILTLAAATPAAGRMWVDPTLARGLSYYTGAIMEIVVPDLAGSLGGGGRYDNLVGMFLGRDVPACGFSLGLERIIVVMTQREMFPKDLAGSGVDAMVTIWNDESRADALTLAGELRRAGLRVDVYPETDKLGKQFKYAAGCQIPFVLIVGDDERAKGMVSVKDLRSGDQQIVARAETADYVRARR